MKNIYLLIVAILGNVSLIHSQTNLICHGTFSQTQGNHEISGSNNLHTHNLEACMKSNVSLSARDSDSSLKTLKPVYVEGGGSAYKSLGAVSMNYFIGLNWKKSNSTRWTKELSLFVHYRNPFKTVTAYRLTLNSLSYGMGYEFIGKRRFFFKPSIHAGLHYMRYDALEEFQYNVGIQLHTKIQYGVYYKRFRFSLTTQVFSGWSYFQFYDANGQNVNPNLKFPIDYNGFLFHDITISYKLN